MSDLLSVRDLVVDYRAGRRRVRALDAVSLDIPAGQTLGLVGESGSGKTTLGRAILGLTPVTAGTITFDGADITRLPAARRRDLGRQIQAVFQDPYGSLNPALRVSAILGESLRAAGPLPRAEAQTRLRDMLARTGMPESAMARYPGAFSGGQRQRLAIARALMPGPRLVICDEATSALDLSVQAQILNLLCDLQRELSVSYLFIGHNLDVVRFVADRIAVLYHGQLLEEGPASAVSRQPRHPYTQSLVAASRPRMTAAAGEPQVTGAVESAGCAFAPRCHLATDVCRRVKPPVVRLNGASAACHHLPSPEESV
jgi:oligopeptide/dipeptide ABC transporter ATP-binding protein